MGKRLTTILLSIVFAISLASLSYGFGNDANKDETTPDDPNDQRSYTRENSSKPVSQGGYKGGHDTITGEAALLKKDVHNDDTKFKDWIDQESLPSLRTGAHDEDTNKLLNSILNDPPIGPNGWGDFFKHFYDPDTGCGLKCIFNPAPERAKDYIRQIKKIACGPDGKMKNLSPDEKKKIYKYE